MGFSEKLDKIFEEKVPGGKASGKTVEDIAKKHGVSVEYIEKQLKMGMEIEKEHSPDPATRKEISLDHLEEFKDYYTRLDKMEKSAKNDQSK
jgi:hypothetical protein